MIRPVTHVPVSAILILGVLLTIVTVNCWIQDPIDEEKDRKERLAQNVLNRQKHVAIFRGTPVNLTDYQGRWFLSYAGRPFDMELIIIIFFPAWIGLLLGFCFNVCLHRAFKTSIEEEMKARRPKVSIIKLQQSKLEQKLGQTNVIGMAWYAKRFVIRADDPYVDIDSIVQQDKESKSALRRNPWRLVRQMTKWIGWYLQFKRNMDASNSQSSKPAEEFDGAETQTDEITRRLDKVWAP